MAICLVQFTSKRHDFVYSSTQKYISFMSWTMNISLKKKLKKYIIHMVLSNNIDGKLITVNDSKLIYPENINTFIQLGDSPFRISVKNLLYINEKEYSINFVIMSDKLDYICTTCNSDKIYLSHKIN